MCKNPVGDGAKRVRTLVIPIELYQEMRLYSKGMTGLTKIAITARKIIRYTIFFIIFLTVGKVVLDLSIKTYRKAFPSPPPPPTVKFGKLTKIPLPEASGGAQLTYVLETPEGGFPTNIPAQVKVFFMPRANPNLLSLDVAKEKVRALAFTSDPIQQSDTLYKFTNPDFPSAIEINIITGSFSISYDLSIDKTPLDQKPPVPEVAASEFRGQLSNANVLPDDLTGTTTHNFFKLTNNGLTPAVSLSESDVVKVNLFRKNYDNLPSLTAKPDEANIWAIIGGSSNREQRIIAAEYHYHPVDETQFSTYPIKTPEEAFGELESGGAYIADLGINNDGDTLKIRRIYLAYFDPDEVSDFFQPIYVFEGDNGFVGYIPAVIADYYGE